MFGKGDLVDNLNRDLDRARGRRNSLASEVTTLTAQIAEIEAHLSEEKARQERDHVLAEIEAIKQRLKRAISAFAPVIGELCEATQMAAAVMPEARELNSFLYRLRQKSIAWSIPYCTRWINAQLRCESATLH